MVETTESLSSDAPLTGFIVTFFACWIILLNPNSSKGPRGKLRKFYSAL